MSHGSAGGLVFLLAFADFELASLWSVKTWTMAVFDAQAGGYALGATLRLAGWPLGVQLSILAAIALARRNLRGVTDESPSHGGVLPWAYLGDLGDDCLCRPGSRSWPGRPSRACRACWRISCSAVSWVRASFLR
ncbi:MAG: hypothetical protein WDN28_22400 [Chthoniobacter sp.]